jgi:hypothetical protein
MKTVRAASSVAEAQQPRQSFALWLGVVGPPLIWLAQFEIKYALAGAVPGGGRHFALMSVAIASLALLVASGLMSRRHTRLAETSSLDREAGIGARTHFMGVLGMMSAALFFLATAAQAIADWFFQPGPG